MKVGSELGKMKRILDNDGCRLLLPIVIALWLYR